MAAEKLITVKTVGPFDHDGDTAIFRVVEDPQPQIHLVNRSYIGRNGTEQNRRIQNKRIERIAELRAHIQNKPVGLMQLTGEVDLPSGPFLPDTDRLVREIGDGALKVTDRGEDPLLAIVVQGDEQSKAVEPNTPIYRLGDELVHTGELIVQRGISVVIFAPSLLLEDIENRRGRELKDFNENIGRGTI